MASIAAGLVGSLIPGLAGLFGGGKQQKVQTSGTISNTGTGTFNQGGTSSSTNTGSTTPNLTPLQQALIKQFSGGASNLFSQSQNLNPYAASGLEQINAGGDVANKVLQNSLAARGLSYSPAAANATTQNTLNTVNQGSQFLNQLPLLQRQLQQQSLGQLMQAFQVQPVGTTTTGTQQGTTQQSGSTTQNQTQTQNGTNLVSGNPMGGLFSGLGAGLLGPNSSGNGSNLSDIIHGIFGGGGPSYSGPGTPGGAQADY